MPMRMEAALRYAALGYPVFPCAPGGKAPLTPRGFKDATTDPGQIQSWWEKFPDANIGLPTAGLLVIDVDGADNPWPAETEKALDLVRGPVSRTLAGGATTFSDSRMGKRGRTRRAKSPRMSIPGRTADTLEAPHRTHGLELFELLLHYNAYKVRDVLMDIDRRPGMSVPAEKIRRRRRERRPRRRNS